MKSEHIKEAIKKLFEQELSETKGTDKDVIKFDFESRMSELAEQAKYMQLGTHISKGINPLSKGGTVLFKKDSVNTPSTLMGSHNIPNPEIDITGASIYYVADASIYSFLNLELPDGSKLIDLLITNDERLKKALSDDEDKSERIFDKLSNMILNPISGAEVDTFNKQIYFPLNADESPLSGLDGFKYINLVPLYPSSLNKEITFRLKQARELKRDAWDAYNKKQVGEEFSTIENMALIGIGGTRPANTSKLAQKSAGSSYLLCNLPPKVVESKALHLPKYANSLFKTNLLRNHTHHAVVRLMLSLTKYGFNSSSKNKVEANLVQAISAILDLALELKKNNKGWLSDYNLNVKEKFWLDSSRGDIEGQQSYKSMREDIDWKSDIVAEIANFLILQVGKQAKYKKKKLLVELDAYLFEDWRVTTQKTIDKYNRYKKEVL